MVLGFLFISMSCFSMESEKQPIQKEHSVEYLKPEGPVNQSIWVLKVSKKKGYEHFDLYKKGSKKPFLSNTAELITHSFTKATIVKFKRLRFLVTQWGSGAHGEEVLIFDLNLKEPKPIWTYVSSWPATLEMTKTDLLIHGTGDMDFETSEPKKDTKKWNPTIKQMDFSLESEASQSSESE
ncbi:MAG: hypothetical protein ACJAT2_000586 [Bacteriovoracaceae bacterium]|jgi:hypothetical protein